MTKEKNIERFNIDVHHNLGYKYTAGAGISSQLSNARISQEVRSIASLKGRKVIDVGCGDGTYTMELEDDDPAFILGVDAADAAVVAAREKSAHSKITSFKTVSVYDLSSIGEHFDVAIVRGLLHHLYEPHRAIAEICNIADEIIVIEPNGYNPILKLIEKTSSYHIAHEEKSYSPHCLRWWFGQEKGQLVSSRYIGLVPFFCPDFIAKVLKAIEPIFEAIPLVRTISCGQYVQHIKIQKHIGGQKILT